MKTKGMSGFALHRIQYYSPLAQVFVLVVGVAISFLLAYAKGDVTLYLPFISETGAFPPSQGVFSLSLFIGSIIGILIVFSRFIILNENQLVEENSFKILNVSSCIIGIILFFGMAGVAAFPMTTVFWCHILCASIYFIFTFLYFSTMTYTTYKIHGKSTLFYFRFVLTAVILILMTILVICFPISLLNWHQHNEIIPALKTPENEGFTLIFISSLLEWTIMGLIVAYTLSLTADLGHHSLLISTVKEERQRDSSIEGIVPEAIADSSIAT